ncbi:hypothetical protein J3R03_004641 [Actinoplanes couchii]|nr:hypothetical protein [Actinoplanes couchii]
MHSKTVKIRVSDRKLAEFESRLGDRRFKWIWNRDNVAHIWFFRSGLVKLRTSGFTSTQMAPHFRGRFTTDADGNRNGNGNRNGKRNGNGNGNGTLTGTIRESVVSLTWVVGFALSAALALFLGLGSLLAEGFGWVPGYIVLAVAAFLFWLAHRTNRDRPSNFELGARIVEDRLKRLFGR